SAVGVPRTSSFACLVISPRTSARSASWRSTVTRPCAYRTAGVASLGVAFRAATARVNMSSAFIIGRRDDLHLPTRRGSKRTIEATLPFPPAVNHGLLPLTPRPVDLPRVDV